MDELTPMGVFKKIEIGDANGRVFSEWTEDKIKVSVQEDGDTLKIFLEKIEK